MFLYDTKEYAKADQAFNAALQIEPQNMWLYIGLGDLNRIQGRFDLAEQYYSRAKQIDPSSDAPDMYLRLNAEEKNKHNVP